MTVEETVLEKVKVLPPNRKQEVLDFVEFLENKELKNKQATVDSAIEEVFATRKTLLAKLAEGAK